MNYDDLKEAVRHGQSLVNMEIVSMEGLQNEVRRVVGEVMRWGESYAVN